MKKYKAVIYMLSIMSVFTLTGCTGVSKKTVTGGNLQPVNTSGLTEEVETVDPNVDEYKSLRGQYTATSEWVSEVDEAISEGRIEGAGDTLYITDDKGKRKIPVAVPDKVRKEIGNARAKILEEALKFKGTSYDHGVNIPKVSVDCSGLVKVAYMKGAGIDITTGEGGKELIPKVDTCRWSLACRQFFLPENGKGKQVKYSELKPADLVFLDVVVSENRALPVNHVAMYQGDGKFLESTLDYSNGINGFVEDRTVDAISYGNLGRVKRYINIVDHRFKKANKFE